MSEAGIVAIVVAIAGPLIAGPIMWMLHRFDKRNTKQHNDNVKAFDKVREKIEDVALDVREVKADVRELKADHRALSEDHRRLSVRFDAQHNEA
jgi:outer membrane murein-binding lipoprotein Lpp